MIKKLRNILLPSAMTLMFAMTAIVPSLVAVGTAGAACTGVADTIAQGAQDASGGGTVACSDATGLASGESSVTSIATEIVKIFSLIVGATSVFMIIYGGFRYITSGGDSNRVGSAKNTLIYAIVGLIIVALAQLIVHFVLSSANNATSSVG